MADITIEDMPEDVRLILDRRADRAGQSLEEYVRSQLISEARTPSVDEVLSRVGLHRGGHLPVEDAVRLLHESRDER